MTLCLPKGIIPFLMSLSRRNKKNNDQTADLTICRFCFFVNTIHSVNKERKSMKKTEMHPSKERDFLIPFCIILLSGAILLALEQVVRVGFLGKTFFSNTVFGSYDWDYYMDYFNVNSWVFPGSTPYLPPARSSYPPLALLLAAFFAMFGDYSGGSLAAQKDPIALFSYYMVFFLFTLLSYLALRRICKERGYSQKRSLLLGIAFLVSAPYIYLFGRGNYLFVVVTALFWFFALYQSEKKWEREASLLLLSVAAGIKLYPALFAALLLRKRRFADFFKTVLYTVLLFFLPFLFFGGGFQNIKLFLANLFDFQGNGQASDHNYSMATFFFYIAQLTNGLTLTEAPEWTLIGGRMTAFLILPSGVFLSMFSKKQWQAAALIALAVILFPAPSYVYSACMLLPSSLLFLTEARKTRKDGIYFWLFVLIFLPVQWGYLVSPRYVLFGLNISNVLQHIAMLILFLVLCFDSARRLPYLWRACYANKQALERNLFRESDL